MCGVHPKSQILCIAEAFFCLLKQPRNKDDQKAQTVRVSCSSYKIANVAQALDILNPKGNQNGITG